MSDTARDPYLGLQDYIRGQNSIPEFGIEGTVLSASPLRVRAEGLDLDAEDIRVSSHLTPTYVGSLAAALGADPPGDVPQLVAGDGVLLIPSLDRQIYYLIAKL